MDLEPATTWPSTNYDEHGDGEIPEEWYLNKDSSKCHMQVRDITYVEVTTTDASTVNLFKEFYTEIYAKAFTDANTSDTYDNLIKRLNKCDKDSLHVHIILARCEDETIGGIIFDYLDDLQSIIVEYIVVKESFRRMGVATNLYEHMHEVLECEYKKPIRWLFAELEVPDVNTTLDVSYLTFWGRQGLKLLEMPYVQPPREEGKKVVTNLRLCGKCTLLKATAVNSLIISQLLDTYFTKSIGVDLSNLDSSVSIMFDFLQHEMFGSIRLVNLSEIYPIV